MRAEQTIMHGHIISLFYAVCGLLATGDAFCAPAGSLMSHRAPRFASLGYSSCRRERTPPPRDVRTRLFESVSQNRDKINRAMNRLREALRSEDHELAERLKAFIVYLRARDPQFATQDAMEDALSSGLFSTAAKLKLRLTEINQNPFRQGLLLDVEEGNGEKFATGGDIDDVRSSSSTGNDVAEDMSWGFDQTFFGEDGEGAGAEDEEDYDDI